jgi:hypothetical protein
MKFVRLIGLSAALALPLSAYADTPESTAQIQNDLRDGQPAGSITPGVIRNFAVSVFNPYPTVVSAAGTTQGTATVLTSQFNIIATCAAGAGVMATSYYTKIWNTTANACLVYPTSGAQFNTNGTNQPISVPAGGAAEFIMQSTTQGYWHSASCAQGAGYADGCSSAPAGTAQYPSILASYAKRPPWNVVGVDYHVGVPANTTLKDPTTATLPTGCAFSGSTVTCSSGSPVLDGWDFSLHNGTTLSITGGGTVTVRNSKFVVGSNQGALGNIIKLGSGSFSTSFLNNEIDGANVAVTAQQGQTVSVSNTGTNTFQYNYFHNSGGDVIDFNTGTRTDIIQYNVFKDIGVNTQHSDTFQWFGSVEQNDVIAFNLGYQTVNEPGAGMGQFSLFGEGAGSNLTNSRLSNNTVIQLAACTSCNWTLTLELDAGAIGDHDILQDNYIDPTGAVSFTGMWLFANQSAAATFPSPSAVVGNVNMVTGATYTSYPAAQSWVVVPDSNGYTPPMSDVYATTANPASGTVTTGNITFSLATDEPFTVTGGTPSLTLSNGRTAQLTGGSGTSTLVFTYAVQSGDTATSLAISSVNLNGATINDSVGNTANLSTVPQTFAGLNVSGGGGGTCAQGSTYPDGCPSAPTATTQYPTLLSSYTKRPPWNVAGVDYPVGVPSNITLKDPAVDALPSACSYSSGTFTVSCSGTFTLSGWDFSLHGGVKVSVSSGSGWTITQNKFGSPTNCLDPMIDFRNAGGTVTISYNTMDGGGALCSGTGPGTPGNFNTMIYATFNAGASLIMQYNWLKNIWSDGIDFVGTGGGTATTTLKYNLFDEFGWNGHPDIEQYGPGTYNSDILSYNMVRQVVQSGIGNGSQPFHTESQQSNTITNHSTDHNTLVFPGSNSASAQDSAPVGSAQTANYLISCKNDGAGNTQTGYKSDANYMDATGAYGFYTDSCNAASAGSAVYDGVSASFDMITGAQPSHP